MINNAIYLTSEEMSQLELSLTMTEGAGEETQKMLRLLRSVQSQHDGSFKIKIIRAAP